MYLQTTMSLVKKKCLLKKKNVKKIERRDGRSGWRLYVHTERDSPPREAAARENGGKRGKTATLLRSASFLDRLREVRSWCKKEKERRREILSTIEES